MPRKGENIYKRNDNRWEGRYQIIMSDGSKKYKSVYAKSYTEIKAKLALCKEKARQGIDNLPKCRLTVAAILQNWLNTKQSSVKLSSYIRYANLINNQLKPGLGHLPINKLNVQILSRFLRQKSETGRLDKQGGLSAKTIADLLTIIKAAVKLAATEYTLPQAAAIAEVKAPGCQPKPVDTFSEQDTRLICQHISQKPTAVNLAILLSLNCGLRLGEVCALQWQDIDWPNQTLIVQHNVQRATVDGKSRLLLQTPKSESSHRVIPLTAQILTLLGNMQKTATGAFVFGNTKPLEPRTLQYRFAALLQGCGIKKRNFHTLRHTFATRYIAAGADVKSLSEILGHAKVNITMQLYVHPTLEQKRANLESINILRELCA